MSGFGASPTGCQIRTRCGFEPRLFPRCDITVRVRGLNPTRLLPKELPARPRCHRKHHRNDAAESNQMVMIHTHEDGSKSLNLSLGVGLGRANNIDDVMYVQFLLNQIIQSPSGLQGLKKDLKGYGTKLKVDGIIGPRTKAQIRKFQSWASIWGFRILADGCVDRVKYSTNQPTIEHTLTTIIYFYYRLNLNIDYWDQPDFPRRLQAMARVVAQAPHYESDSEEVS